MKNLYESTKWIFCYLLWAGITASQTAVAQTVPAVQWNTTVSRGLAIKTDGTIATADSSRRQEAVVGQFILIRAAANYSLAGDRVLFRSLDGITLLNQPSRPFSSFFTSVLVMAATTNNETGYIGNEYNTGNILFTKLSADGNRQLANKSIGSTGSPTIYEDLTGTPDGGFVLLVTSPEPNAKTVAVVRKFDADLNETWTKSLSYPTPNPATPDRSLTRGKTIITTPDGGYLVAGYYNTTGQLDAPQTGWAAKLNGQGDVAWQKLLPDLQSVTDAILTADGSGYTLVGTGIPSIPLGGHPAAIAILELNTDGGVKRVRSTGIEATPQSFITQYTSGGRGFYAIGTTSGGQHPQLVLVNQAGLDVVTQRVFSNSPAYGALLALAVAGDGSLVFNTANNALVKLRVEATSGFALTQPTYNCQTGAITFNTSGGDGSPITYSAPGIMRASPTSNSGTVEPGLRADPKTIPITATQNGQSSTFIFDLAAFCSTPPPPPNPPSGGPLSIAQPTYNCQTGAISFNTTGGDSSPIVFTAPGISRNSPTNTFGIVEPGLRADPKTIPITATQNGVSVTVNFDLKAACGQSRIGIDESVAGLTTRVLPNPVVGSELVVEVTGAGGQPIDFVLSDAMGRMVSSQRASHATDKHRQTMVVGHLAGGMYLLRVSSGTRSNVVKVLKH